ncbi:MAG: hypothetical protein ACQEQV_09600 [Fibrobacterota bacterium]
MKYIFFSALLLLFFSGCTDEASDTAIKEKNSPQKTAPLDDGLDSAAAINKRIHTHYGGDSSLAKSAHQDPDRKRFIAKQQAILNEKRRAVYGKNKAQRIKRMRKSLEPVPADSTAEASDSIERK